MTLAVDSNILSAVFRGEDTALRVVQILEERRGEGLLLHVPAFAEVLSGPGIRRVDVEAFLSDAGISLVWETEAAVWERAISAFTLYAERRRKSGGGQPRRILADFLIGAHAAVSAGELLMLDPQHYRQSFPELVVLSPLKE